MNEPSYYCVRDNMLHDVAKLAKEVGFCNLLLDDVFATALAPFFYLNKDDRKGTLKSELVKRIKGLSKDIVRYRCYAKTELVEAIKTEILPRYSFEDKVKTVKSIPIVKSVDSDGKVHLHEKSYEFFSQKDSELKIHYGVHKYVPTSTRDNAAINLDSNKLRSLIEDYCEHWETEVKENDEFFKWEAAVKFHNTFNINSKDLALNLKDSLSRASVLFDKEGLGNSKDIFVTLAELQPEAIRDALLRFENAGNLEENVKNFKEVANNAFKLAIQKGLYKSNFSSQQQYHELSVYIAFIYPSKYYIYKYDYLKLFFGKTSVADKVSIPQKERLNFYFRLCDMVKKELEKNKELIAKHDKMFPNDSSNHNLLTFDFIHYCANRHNG